MTKLKTKKPDSRAKALHAMNRATLIHTVQTLDKRQVTLLNKIARLEGQIAASAEMPTFVAGDEQQACELFNVAVQDHDLLPRNKMPWET